MYPKLYLLLLLPFLFTGISIAQTINLSGKVIRHNGAPVAGVTVTCTNADPVISDENGGFTFSNLPAGEPYLINGVFSSPNIYEGITILDLLFTANSNLGLNDYLSPAQPIAGDLNNSGSLTTFDLIKYRFAVVQKGGLEISPDWLFFDANASIPNSGIYINNQMEDVEDLELVSVKKGDIALEADHLPAPINGPEPIYYFENQTIAAGEIFEVAVKVNDFQSIVGFQHGLEWNPSTMDYVSFEFGEVGGAYNDVFGAEGAFLMYGGEYLENLNGYYYLEDGSILYTLTFQAIQNIENLGAELNFSDAIIPLQTVFSTDQHILFLSPDQYQEGIVTSIEGRVSLETFNVHPNLTRESSEVQLQFSTPQKGQLQLLDMNGRLLISWLVEGQQFQKTISLTNLTNGTYALQLRTDQGVITKRIIKQ